MLCWSTGYSVGVERLTVLLGIVLVLGLLGLGLSIACVGRWVRVACGGVSALLVLGIGPLDDGALFGAWHERIVWLTAIFGVLLAVSPAFAPRRRSNA
jgi:hypothetical protein